jgi:DNA-binding SARP family transcriptional activator
MDVLWKIELFGGLKLIGQDRTVSRFQTYKTGALLGYLCSHAQIVPRDVLVELLWPDADLEAARNSLRVALNSLRRQIEPPSIQPGAVLMTSRSSIQLNRDVIVTDVQEFERLLQQAAHATDETQQKDFLVRAVACYQGPFLPGHYEDWVTPERLRLADAYAGALRRLTRVLVVCRDLDGALDIARRALVADPLHESSHCNLMQL